MNSKPLCGAISCGESLVLVQFLLELLLQIIGELDEGAGVKLFLLHGLIEDHFPDLIRVFK